MSEPLGDDEKKGNEENAEDGGADHAAEYRRADGVTGRGARAMGDDQWE